MAEFVMKDLVEETGVASHFHIESAATSREEIGNPVYPPARNKLAEHGIGCSGHAARQLTRNDYDKYDLLIGMDSANLHISFLSDNIKHKQKQSCNISISLAGNPE